MDELTKNPLTFIAAVAAIAYGTLILNAVLRAKAPEFSAEGIAARVVPA